VADSDEAAPQGDDAGRAGDERPGLLHRLLAPFRSEQAAFRIVLVTAAAAVVLFAVVSLVRAL
jgi:hypothetical protein